MPRRSRPQALTIWEKKYTMHLVSIGGLDSAVEATRELKNALGFDVCVEIVKNALGLAERFQSKLYLPQISKRG